MTDYDATVAFDRVLHSISVLSNQRLGMPQHTSIFLYNLLQNMEFTLLTRFGESSMAFKNNEDPLQTGQGMLQGSSSAAPMYNVTSDVSLSAYKKLAKGATFIHPISGTAITDYDPIRR
jgi:hypothetical protein